MLLYRNLIQQSDSSCSRLIVSTEKNLFKREKKFPEPKATSGLFRRTVRRHPYDRHIHSYSINWRTQKKSGMESRDEYDGLAQLIWKSSYRLIFTPWTLLLSLFSLILGVWCVQGWDFESEDLCPYLCERVISVTIILVDACICKWQNLLFGTRQCSLT